MTEISRSLRPEVRNPVLELPEMQLMLDLKPEVRAVVAQLFRALARQCRERAQKSWRKNKGPMALYYKVFGVYFGHIYRAMRPPRVR